MLIILIVRGRCIQGGAEGTFSRRRQEGVPWQARLAVLEVDIAEVVITRHHGHRLLSWRWYGLFRLELGSNGL